MAQQGGVGMYFTYFITQDKYKSTTYTITSLCYMYNINIIN